MLKLIIGNRAYSSWSMRGWLACKQSGEPFEEYVVPLFDAEWEERRHGDDAGKLGQARIPAQHLHVEARAGVQHTGDDPAPEDCWARRVNVATGASTMAVRARAASQAARGGTERFVRGSSIDFTRDSR